MRVIIYKENPDNMFNLLDYENQKNHLQLYKLKKTSLFVQINNLSKRNEIEEYKMEWNLHEMYNMCIIEIIIHQK